MTGPGANASMRKPGNACSTAARNGSPISDSPPPKHNNRRMKQMRHMRKPERQVFGCFFKNGRRPMDHFAPGRRRETWLRARGLSRHFAPERCPFLARRQTADSGIDRPSRAAGFQQRPGAIQANMPDLRFSRRARRDKPSRPRPVRRRRRCPKSRKNRIEPDARAAHSLAQGAEICVVVNNYGRFRQRTQPRGQRKLRPPFNLVRTANAACLPIHRPAKPDSNRFRADMALASAGMIFSSCARMPAPPGRFDLESVPFQNARFFVADKDLEFGAADFDAEIKAAAATITVNHTDSAPFRCSSRGHRFAQDRPSPGRLVRPAGGNCRHDRKDASNAARLGS
jgi:hypothetical protein